MEIGDRRSISLPVVFLPPLTMERALMQQIDPWEALYRMARSPQVLDLKSASDELREIRARFAPIHDYYFPKSWLTSLARLLHAAHPPDFSMHLSELKDMHDAANRIIEEARTTLETIPREKVARQFRQLAQLTFEQIYLDAKVIIAMYEFVKGRHENIPRSARTRRADIEEFSHKAHENASRLRTWRLDFEESTLDPAAWDTQIPK
jgi:hypothetical protein